MIARPRCIQLSEHLLRPRAPQIAADGAVKLIEAPDPAREVGAILRRVKRLLLDGTPPDDILIAVRDWGQYGGQIAAQGRRYGLPLALHYGDPLAQNPAVVALLNLIDLHAGDFRRRDLLDVLRSPYFAVPGIDAAQVDLLERISREFRVLGGRERVARRRSRWRRRARRCSTTTRTPKLSLRWMPPLLTNWVLRSLTSSRQ